MVLPSSPRTSSRCRHHPKAAPMILQDGQIGVFFAPQMLIAWMTVAQATPTSLQKGSVGVIMDPQRAACIRNGCCSQAVPNALQGARPKTYWFPKGLPNAVVFRLSKLLSRFLNAASRLQTPLRTSMYGVRSHCLACMNKFRSLPPGDLKFRSLCPGNLKSPSLPVLFQHLPLWSQLTRNIYISG